MKHRITTSLLVFLIIASVASCSKETSVESTAGDTTDSTTKTSVETTATTTAETSETHTSTTEAPAENTYEHNKYYDVVEEGYYTQGKTSYVIHKVKAKDNCKIDVTATAYDKDYNVLDTTSDDVMLIEGAYSYFRYAFDDVDLSAAMIDFSASTEQIYPTAEIRFTDMGIRRELGSENWMDVSMIAWNKKKDKELFVTVMQNASELSSLDGCRILYYKDGKIISSDYTFLDTKKLNKVGATEVLTFYIPSEAKDFDNIEFFFDPSDFWGV